ncbi:ribonuclease P protein component 3 [Methanocella arvoryzae]|uniref:Ribonuclease P protein component 3 n=1 Tax=Methanocella arvoryzae (strain DSM 22066 / NBRC 105507 / MRE50) TaxID=351160 RepID=Q0W2Z3_METAR|nr:ribonuclease P protein component 3 [Methanocella arvoryzae]CAJ37250.1 putative RNase P, component 3 [Methanocella arvoryzae MRE50]
MPASEQELHYYDMNIHPYPEGSSSVSRMALEAGRLGLSGICASPHHDFFAGKEPLPQNFKVLRGVEVSPANANELRRLVEKYRSRVQVLAVHGGDEAINRAACEDGRADVLTHPHDGGKTSGINHIIAKLAADKQVAIEFSLFPIIHNRGGTRVRTLSSYRANFALVRKYGAPYVITSGAMSHYDLRDPRCMIAIARLFGLNEAEAIKGLTYYPEQIIRRSSASYVMDGVEIVGAGGGDE